MQSIQVAVVRSRSYCASDGFDVYGDGGTGVIDWAHPATPRRQLFWQDVPEAADHLLGGHVMPQHLGGPRFDGHVEGTHLLDAHLWPAAAVVYETNPVVFGRFHHAVVTRSGTGNETTAGVTVYETVVNSSPPAARDLRPVAYEPALERLTFTFTFTPSDRLTG